MIHWYGNRATNIGSMNLRASACRTINLWFWGQCATRNIANNKYAERRWSKMLWLYVLWCSIERTRMLNWVNLVYCHQFYYRGLYTYTNFRLPASCWRFFIWNFQWSSIISYTTLFFKALNIIMTKNALKPWQVQVITIRGHWCTPMISRLIRQSHQAPLNTVISVKVKLES
jgi:hypothetical protein